MQIPARISFGRSILRHLPAWIKEDGHTHILVAADINTEKYARSVIKELNGIHTDLFVYDSPSLTPDEAAAGQLFIAAEEKFNAMLAVGSGTLNDLARFVSSRLRIPYYIAATAASMDGYTSSVAPLTVKGLKKTYAAHPPAGVLADADIFETAPPEMTSAGFGDVTGKCTSLMDWELEAVVMETGDFCPGLAEEMRRTVKACAENTETAETVKTAAPAVMKALLDSGLVMQRAGNSKPASGSEHHLSHFWEMMALTRRESCALHGAKVGVAVLSVLRIAEWLLKEEINWEKACKNAESFDIKQWRKEIKRIYGPASNGVLSLWQNEIFERKRLIKRLRENWLEITGILRKNTLPRERIIKGLKKMNAAVTPGEINIKREDFVNGCLYANRIRKRFTVWRLADILGLLPEYTERLADECEFIK